MTNRATGTSALASIGSTVRGIYLQTISMDERVGDSLCVPLGDDTPDTAGVAAWGIRRRLATRAKMLLRSAAS